MNLTFVNDKDFCERLSEIVLANLGNEKFGVKELALSAGTSQSYIRKRLKKVTKKSVSHFICEIRLRQAEKLIRESDRTASEVAYQVGFGSASYFYKCFHEFYGFPVGDLKRKSTEAEEKINAAKENGLLTDDKPDPVRKNRILSYAILIVGAVLLSIGIYSYFIRDSAGSGKGRLKRQAKSIAVLPFKNLSGDLENRYFTDGVVEDILSHLNNIRQLEVTSRTSVEQYRESTKNIREIARELDVRYILEGSVQKEGYKVRVRIQLIDALSDLHVISETYDRELSAIFQIQTQIAKQVAEELEAVLSPEEKKLLERIPTTNTEAYQLYLKGRFFWSKRTREGFEKSIEFFKAATEADPDYALAWTGLGDGYFYISWWDWYDPGQVEGFQKAKEYALKALELDDHLAEAHVLLGNILFWHEWKWQEAEAELDLAVRLNPKSAHAHWVYAELLDILCKRVKCREHMNRAIELDPVFFMLYSSSATFYYNDGNFEASAEECRKALELNPDFCSKYENAWSNYYYLGNLTLSIEFLQKYLDCLSGLKPEYIHYNDSVRSIYTGEGMEGVLNWLIGKELSFSRSEFEPLASLYLKAGKKDEALKMLEKGFEAHDIYIVKVISRYDYHLLYNEPLYREIVRKMGLADYLNNALASGELTQ